MGSQIYIYTCHKKRESESRDHFPSNFNQNLYLSYSYRSMFKNRRAENMRHIGNVKSSNQLHFLNNSMNHNSEFSRKGRGE